MLSILTTTPFYVSACVYYSGTINIFIDLIIAYLSGSNDEKPLNRDPDRSVIFYMPDWLTYGKMREVRRDTHGK